MIIQKNKRIKYLEEHASTILIVVALVLLVLMAATAMGKPGAQRQGARGFTAVTSPGKLVIVLTTGPEAMHETELALRYALAVKRSGGLREVDLLADGRGVEALAAVAGSGSPALGKLAGDAKAAGVRLIVSGEALKQAGIAPASLDPKPDEIVPDGALKLADLIRQQHQVMRF